MRIDLRLEPASRPDCIHTLSPSALFSSSPFSFSTQCHVSIPVLSYSAPALSLFFLCFLSFSPIFSSPFLFSLFISFPKGQRLSCFAGSLSQSPESWGGCRLSGCISLPLLMFLQSNYLIFPPFLFLLFPLLFIYFFTFSLSTQLSSLISLCSILPFHSYPQ